MDSRLKMIERLRSKNDASVQELQGAEKILRENLKQLSVSDSNQDVKLLGCDMRFFKNLFQEQPRQGRK